MKPSTDKAYPSLILLILCILVLAPQLRAQTDGAKAKIDKAPAFLAESNIAVPDYPAFAILGTTPSEILRPNSPHDLSVIISNTFGQGLLIPASFAFETSPWLLVKPGATLGKYDSNAGWARLRVSIGVISTEHGSRNLSAGIRWSITDETDARANGDLRNELVEIAEAELKAETECRDRVFAKTCITPERYLSDADVKSIVDVFTEACASPITAPLDTQIVLKRKQFEQSRWNAPQLELAAAIRGAVSEDPIQGIDYSASAVWITGSTGFGLSWLQLIGSVRFLSERAVDAETNNSVSGALQANAGWRDARLSAEFDGYVKGHASAQLGCSFRLFDELWANASFGWKHRFSTAAEFIKSITFSLTPLH